MEQSECVQIGKCQNKTFHMCMWFIKYLPMVFSILFGLVFILSLGNS